MFKIICMLLAGAICVFSTIQGVAISPGVSEQTQVKTITQATVHNKNAVSQHKQNKQLTQAQQRAKR